MSYCCYYPSCPNTVEAQYGVCSRHGGGNREFTPSPAGDAIQKQAPQPLFRLLDFTAVWCGPCKPQKRILDAWGPQHPDVEIVIIDVDKEKEKEKPYRVQSLPTLIIESTEGARLARATGEHTAAELDALLGKARRKNAKMG
jgi:thioredoxin 1